MGGSAFAPENLSTPRMPPEVYQFVLLHVESLLRPHFSHVGHALEAPAKSSHGDIDVLVASPVIPSTGATGDVLAKVLGAHIWKRTAGSPTFNFALKWPAEWETHALPEDERRLGGSGNPGTTVQQTQEQNEHTPLSTAVTLPSGEPASGQIFVQVDIHVCPSPAYFHWHLFFQAHGDLWNILGGIIRRQGLTCSSKGLSLRIAEVEAHNKEQSRVLMSNDPHTVLAYLGLNIDRYDRMFETWDEMLAYAATCRFHDPGRWRDRPGDEVGTTAKASLKANDRQRASKRPIFGHWIESYLPAHVDDAPGKDAHLSREEVVEDAKRYFGDEFAARFDARKKKMVRQIDLDKLWSGIRKSLPVEGGEIGYTMKGMKRELAGQEEQIPAAVAEALKDVREMYQEGRFDQVLEWAAANWEQVAARQKALDQEQSRVHLTERLKRDQAKQKG